ncbi:MAG: monovalent cation/H(+) antiporter subunit G [Pseudoruegeria sp.]
MIQILAGLFILCGSFFALIAALGILRLPDVLVRMHASTKAGTLACGLILIGVSLEFWAFSIAVRSVAIVTFLILTAPVASHMIGRAAVRTGVPLWRGRGKPMTAENWTLPSKKPKI